MVLPIKSYHGKIMVQWFPKIGENIINEGFSVLNQPAFGDPPSMETQKPYIHHIFTIYQPYPNHFGDPPFMFSAVLLSFLSFPRGSQRWPRRSPHRRVGENFFRELCGFGDLARNIWTWRFP